MTVASSPKRATSQPSCKSLASGMGFMVGFRLGRGDAGPAERVAVEHAVRGLAGIPPADAGLADRVRAPEAGGEGLLNAGGRRVTQFRGPIRGGVEQVDVGRGHVVGA